MHRKCALYWPLNNFFVHWDHLGEVTIRPDKNQKREAPGMKKVVFIKERIRKNVIEQRANIPKSFMDEEYLKTAHAFLYINTINEMISVVPTRPVFDKKRIIKL